MQGPLDKVWEPSGARLNAHIGGRPIARPMFKIAGSQTLRGPLSTLGMALGYLGLVALLTVAPFWQQAMAPHQNQLLACTDFGGSR